MVSTPEGGLLFAESERRLEIAQQRVCRVLGAQDAACGVKLPVDAERRVGNGDAAVGLRGIVVVTFVLEHCRGAEHRETVGETAGNEELAVILGRQFHRHMAAISGRTLADVNCNVEHTTHHAAHKFGLSEWGTLEMQSAHHSAGRHGFVVLNKIYIAADGLAEGAVVVAFKKIAALVVENAWFKDEHAVNIGFDYFHERSQINCRT